MAGQAYLDAVWDAVPEGAEPELFAERRTFLLDHVEPGDVVLDIGCGEGAFAAAMAERDATPICVEVADEPLRRLRARFPQLTDTRRAVAGRTCRSPTARSTRSGPARSSSTSSTSGRS
jgi:cyclopropane fatty-acyl-phospholipid synthase-like methyltransferase